MGDFSKNTVPVLRDTIGPKRRVLLVGEKRALYMAIHRSRKGKRNTMLGERIALYYKAVTRKALRNEEGEEWQRAS